MVMSEGLMHEALHTSTQRRQRTHRSVFTSAWNMEFRETMLSAEPTGHHVLHR